MKFNLFVFIILFNVQEVFVKAQEQEQPKKFGVSGYVSSLQSVTFDSLQGNWISENLIHNRINFIWYPCHNLSGALEVRNRLLFGESVKLNPNTANDYEKDYGFVKLTTNVFRGHSYLLNTFIDRFWMAYEKNKWRVTLGRQRINWSQTMVWNPNDIFNAYSYFDVDYIERPGSDALRFQYNNSEVSVTELALKMNSQKQLTAAGYYKFNRWNYDFQLLGGILNQTDYVIGTGWSGAVKSIAFRGEMSYFAPIRHITDSTGLFLGSVSLDYTFGNSLRLMGEFLYNSHVYVYSLNFLSYYSAPLSVKNLSFARYNLFLQASYPITPLLSATFAGIYFPQIKGYYLGPSMSYSASDNIEFAVFLQSFRASIRGGLGEEQRLRFNMTFLRAKLSF